MADKDDIQELKDLTAALNDLMKQVGANASEVTAELKGWGRQSLDLVSIFDRIVAKGKDIPESIKDGKDLMSALKSGAVEFDAIRRKSFDLSRRELNEIWKKKEESLTKSLGLEGDRLALIQNPAFIDAEQKMQLLREQQKRDLETSLGLLKRHTEETENIKFELENITEKLNRWGDMIRNPNKAIDGMLMKLGDVPKQILEASQSTDGLGVSLQKAASGGMTKLKTGAKVLFSATGLLIAGVALATAAVVGLVALFKNYWEYLDKNVLPAQAEFNKQIGGTSQATAKLEGQMSSMGDRFDRLGMSFQEGASAVRDVASGLKTVELDPKTLKTGTELTSILKLSADEVGNMALQFQKAEGSIEGVNEMMNVGAKEATAYGLPVNAVLKDMAKAPNILARFGTANRKNFAEATAKAQSYGLSIQDVNKAFGEQMDTFEGTAEASAKLNTIFGTNINSMELMMETNPVKRMEMLRGELLKQGKSWDTMDAFQKNVITSSLGVDKSQAALILSSEKERKVLERKRWLREKEIKVNEKWNKGINSLKRTMINWGSELDRVMRRVTEFIAALFGFEDPAKMITDLTNGMKEGFQSVVSTFSEWTAMLKGDKEASTFIILLQTMVATLKTLGSVVIDAVVAPFKILDSIINTMFKSLNNLYELFLDFSKGNFLQGIKSLGISTFENVGDLLSTFGSLGGLLSEDIGSKSVNDAIVTKDGKVIELNPNDNILATQTPIASTRDLESLGGGSTGAQQSQVRVEVVDVNMDGRRVGEAVVKISRF